ncbi:Zinc carboxypeptidase [Cnuella takakiae]|uniref:Zinc carboxypeptidase n=1 Tax=Cnuella takakiae TaxID=1302690 RepID=A0A1M5I618_9BACT|nr:M14 family metallopeptidase [Cnuella takakiae]OLY93184.1 zinc carboxypeptidase [Cnuella takakiae]SHG23637.1 Zinc carboxypeptidase [Cnuella takakiae]
MTKRFSPLFLLLLVANWCAAQLQSPEQFLGYKVGTRYTPHWRIVEYFRHVAAQKPDMMKLQPYGQTNEGRPLMVAYVSMPQHISNLETIRTNNLRLATAESGSTANAPVITWLSYNVHGNETSSSEAAMMTLYALVDPNNARTKTWLQNSVVVLDPCLNPDGRDRYVNWFNSVVGRQYNPALEAREHREPWPGGRSNHYNFDLNRDWAWQTQLESQQRLKLFNQWMPQIHVDFHEQGVNQPYYFAPAAQPYHEVITPWQRSFQETIGRNHARYFDEKGWLYFTKEVFDLLYPSYGDSYPIFNGSIGMTYEQGGGPAGGLGVLTDEGDTLTLVDRALHHFTTGLSTIEVGSQNAGRLLGEFQSFHRNAATNGVGAYKSYVVKYSAQDAGRIQALRQLLDKNGIRYGIARSANLRGFNFDNGKEEAFAATGSDLVIPTNQAKGTLVNVLFEPRTTVVDSNTYDITAWSMPYVYGLKAFASRTPIAFDAAPAVATVNNPAADPYAYIIRWNGVASAKLAGQLMQRGIRLRSAGNPFTIGNEQFERGAIVVIKTSNQYQPNLWQTVRSLADAAGVQLTPVATGFVDKGNDFGSSKVVPLKNRRVALVTGEGTSSLGAGEIWHFFDQVLEYPVTLVNQADLARFNWKDYDVVILPDGNYRFLSDKASAEQLRTWISGGGNLVALEGAVAQLSRLDWAIKLKKADSTADKDPYTSLSRFESRERDYIQNITPGSIYKVDLDNTHPLGFGYPNYYYTLKQDDNIYEFIKEDGWNVGVIKKGGLVNGFVGNKLQKRLQDGLLYGTQEVGRGNITYLADNVLFRSFWENGKLMFCNAVFQVGQ